MDFKNQWDQDQNKEEKPDNEQPAVDLEKETVATDTASTIKSVYSEKAENSESTPTAEPAPIHTDAPTSSPLASRYITGATTPVQDTAHKARRFLIAYMTTVFSAIVILYGTSWLGYVLTDHFLGPKNESENWFYLDLAPFYISIMATLTVFGIIYIVASRYVAKSASNDSIGLKDWRAYKIVYAIFTALLIATGASVIAGLLYIPLAQLMIADDLDAKRILVQTVSSLHMVLWIGILIWQERLVKKAKQSWLQGFVVVAGVAVVVIATGIFPVGSKTDERYDHRIESDLSSLQSKIETYKSDNKGDLPSNLAVLKYDEDETLKNRIKDYTYTVKDTAKATDTSAQQAKVNATVFKNNSDNSTDTTEMTDEDYYNSLYESMYADKSETTEAAKSYELCATFRTDSTDKKSSESNVFSAALGGSSIGSDSFDSHKTGKICFTRQ